MFVPAFFVCSDGEVLPHSWVCDGFEDCMDGSDEAASKYCNGEGCLVTIGLGCVLDLEFSWSNMEFTLSRPKMVRLPWNKKQTYRLNSKPQMSLTHYPGLD